MTDIIERDGKKYQLISEEPDYSDLKYVIVRTYSAGVFAGYLFSRDEKEVVLKKARRLWYWDGSASLSELCMKGVSKPENCKFPVEVDSVLVTEAIEILDCTEKARLSIAAVPVWTAHA